LNRFNWLQIPEMTYLKQALLCLVLLAAAAGWYVYRNPETLAFARESAGPTGQGPAQGRGAGGGGGNRIPGLVSGGAVNVVTAPVEVDAGGESVLALGTAEAVRSVNIVPEVSGVVSEVLFTPGEPVEEGAVLLHLENAEQQVAVDRARVALEQARDALERAQTLARSNTVSAVALSEAETAAQLAEIELRSAEIELGRRSVAAPFAGVTGLTNISKGDFVTNTTQITTLDDLATMRVGFEVPERWAGRIALGQPIAATALALPGSEFQGRIAAIDNRVDETTRTLRLEAELDNEARTLKSGMAVNAELNFDTAEQLAVPTLSVQWDRRGSFVWKIVEGAARRAQIDILQRESGIVIVQGDLQAGDSVVVEGIQRLREGAKVAEVNVQPEIVDEPALRDGLNPAADDPPSASAPPPARVRS
jgi:RND family efflux transporter MFP subunit